MAKRVYYSGFFGEQRLSNMITVKFVPDYLIKFPGTS